MSEASALSQPHAEADQGFVSPEFATGTGEGPQQTQVSQTPIASTSMFLSRISMLADLKNYLDGRGRQSLERWRDTVGGQRVLRKRFWCV